MLSDDYVVVVEEVALTHLHKSKDFVAISFEVESLIGVVELGVGGYHLLQFLGTR